jgi:hypothetical protein
METLAPWPHHRILLWYLPVVTYEYLFCLPSIERPWPPTQRKGQGFVPWVPRATDYDPKNLDTAQYPTVANDGGTKYPVLNMAPPLLAEEEDPAT